MFAVVSISCCYKLLQLSVDLRFEEFHFFFFLFVGITTQVFGVHFEGLLVFKLKRRMLKRIVCNLLLRKYMFSQV